LIDDDGALIKMIIGEISVVDRFDRGFLGNPDVNDKPDAIELNAYHNLINHDDVHRMTNCGVKRITSLHGDNPKYPG
jgi:hypothetical protein